MDSSLKSLHLQQHTRHQCFGAVPPSRPVSPLNWPTNKAPEWKVVTPAALLAGALLVRSPHERNVYFEEISFYRLLRDIHCRFFIGDESVDSMC